MARHRDRPTRGAGRVVERPFVGGRDAARLVGSSVDELLRHEPEVPVPPAEPPERGDRVRILLLALPQDDGGVARHPLNRPDGR